MGVVLKKTDAAGDITATEMTTAWRRSRASRFSSCPPPAAEAGVDSATKASDEYSGDDIR
jgi:hypothetical protein